jgi:hypothetical protein
MARRADEGLVAGDNMAEGLAISREAGSHQFSVVAGGGHHFVDHHNAAYVVGKRERVTGNLVLYTQGQRHGSIQRRMGAGCNTDL